MRRCGAREARIVLEMAEPEIAAATEKAAHLAGDVAMVDARGLRECLLADRAGAVLLGEQGLVVGDRHPVIILELILALALPAIGALLELAAGIFAPLAPACLVDARSVGLVPGAIVGKRLRTEVRIVGIALLSPFEIRRHERPGPDGCCEKRG